MRILILSQYAGAPSLGMVFRNHVLAKAWIDMGHEVTIVASSFSHVRTRQPAMRGRLTLGEVVDGVPFVWVWGPRYGAGGAIGRVLAMLVFTAWLYVLDLARRRPDIVVVSSPSPFAIFPAVRMARRSRARLIFDIRDLWPLTLVELGGYSPRHPVIRWMQAAEDFACRHADLVTAVPAGADAYLRAHGLPEGRFLAIGNAAPADGRAVALSPQHRELVARLRASGAFVVGYTGALGTANAMDRAVAAVGKTDASVHLVIVGDGDRGADLQSLAADLGLAERVHVLPAVPRDQVPAFLAAVDAAYAGIRGSPLYRLGAGLTKLNDYMLAARPVVYAGADPANAIELSGGGIVCDPDDIDAIAAAIERLRAMPAAERAAMGERGRAWCLENRSPGRQAARILEVLAELPRRNA